MSELLGILLDILAPVAIIVVVGYVAGGRLSLDASTLAKLAYWILGPAFIFDVLASAELAAGLVVRVIGALLGSMAVTGIVAWLVARAAGRPSPTVAAGVMTSVYGNVGNFGLAIVVFTFGDEALALAGLALLVVNIAGLVVGVVGATSQRVSLLRAVRTAVLTPMVVAAAAAVVVNVASIPLAPWIDRPVGLVGSALIPVMLLTLGVQLSGMPLPRVGIDVAIPLGGKLLLAPFAAAILATLVGLTGVPRGVVVLQSAMPAAVFTALVALEHDLEPDLVTTTVLAGTLGSAVTLPAVIALLT